MSTPSSQDRIPFLLGAIPFLGVALTFGGGDWKFRTAALLLALYNLFAAMFGTRMSVLMKTFLWVTNALLAAIMAYDFSITGREWLSFTWAAITACFLTALILYRRDTAASSHEPRP